MPRDDIIMPMPPGNPFGGPFPWTQGDVAAALNGLFESVSHPAALGAAAGTLVSGRDPAQAAFELRDWWIRHLTPGGDFSADRIKNRFLAAGDGNA